MEELITGNSLLDCINWAVSYLEEGNITDARLNAELILSSLSGLSKLELYSRGRERIDGFSMDSFLALVNRRRAGFPLQYLLGNIEFFGLDFSLSREVFIPRPETEILLEWTIDIAKRLDSRNLKLLDIGTGCGNIAVTLAKFLPRAEIYAVDISYAALEVAKRNAQTNGVRERINFLAGNLFEALKEGFFFDLIVSNPPYVPDADFKDLAQELFYEPRIALQGGKEGLFYIERIISSSGSYLKKGGMLIMEIGFGQAQAIKEIFRANVYFTNIEFVRDYQGIERVVLLK